MLEMLRRLRVVGFNCDFNCGGSIVQLAEHPFTAEIQKTISGSVEKIYTQNPDLEFRWRKLQIRRYRILDSAGNGTSHIHIKYGY